MKGPLLLSFPLIMLAYGESLTAQGGGAGNLEPVDLATLVRGSEGVGDSEVFVAADNSVPYSGPVFSTFPTDSTKIREQGTLKDGEWDGLYESFYFNGQLDSRILYADTEYHGAFERYYFNGNVIAKGMYEMGSRCGDWIDVGGNDEIYPPCPD